MTTIATHGPRCGTTALCKALGVTPAAYYLPQRPPVLGPRPRRRSARALRPDEQQTVLALLHTPRFVDLAPAEVYATLLDDGVYHCAEQTMYRMLAAHDEVHERRAQARRPHYTAPELLATSPRTNSEVGISRSSRGRRSGRGITCTCCSTCSVAMWCAGSSHRANRRRSPSA